MRSPFPGMDPFIEAQGLWEDFQNKLMGDMERWLSQSLPPRYTVRLGERSYVEFVDPQSASQSEHLFKRDVGIKAAQAVNCGAASPTSVVTCFRQAGISPGTSAVHELKSRQVELSLLLLL
jgi:hypothetical protein